MGPLTDVVTITNVPLVGSAEFVRGDFFLEWGTSDMLSTIQVLVVQSGTQNTNKLIISHRCEISISISK